MKRISSVLNAKEQAIAPYDLYEATVRHSFVVSSDQAHALHPNYASKHEKNHQPQMNAGMVIKRNANQRYATTGPTGILMREIARRSSLPPVQEFMVRQDCGCVSSSSTCGVGMTDMNSSLVTFVKLSCTIHSLTLYIDVICNVLMTTTWTTFRGLRLAL